MPSLTRDLVFKRSYFMNNSSITKSVEKGDSIGWRQKYRILVPFVLAATIWFLLFIPLKYPVA